MTDKQATRPEAPILDIRHVSKAFGAQRVLNDVCLSVPRGSIVSLLGGSGSGKTTLLQLIAGLLDADGGSILIEGRDMRDIPPYERPVNMMFQSYALFPHLSIADNVAYGLKARGTPKAEREGLVAWALNLVRLDGFERRKPDQLSGGQRQRAALARCLVMRPAILLLDEPMAALDRSLRADVQRELVAIQRKVGATFVMVTHDQEEAMAMSDYVAVMNQGSIAQFGTPREVYEHPATRFVASFLGSINLFDRTDATTLGVRPERIVVSRSATGLVDDYAGTIEEVAYCGSVSQLRIRLVDARILEVTLVNREQGSDHRYAAGDQVYAGFRREDAVELPA